MKKYTDLTFVETAQALEDGKYVEWADTYPTPTKPKWRRKTSKNVNANFRYRLIEEVEEWAADVGEPVLVKIAGSPFKDFGCIYRGMFEGKFITEDISGMLNGWDEIAPVTKIKDLSHLISFDDGMDDEGVKCEPEVCWRNKYPNYLACESYNTLDDAVQAAMSSCLGQVKFVEEIEK